MPSDSEYALKRLVENEGLSIEDAVARMKACQHPNEYDEDSPFTGNTWYVCPDCGFTFCWEYVSLEMPYNLRARAQERWPEEVDAVVAAYQVENQGVAPEPPS